MIFKIFQKRSCWGKVPTLQVVVLMMLVFTPLAQGLLQAPCGAQTASTSNASTTSNEALKVDQTPPQPQGLDIYIVDLGHLIQPEDREVLQQRLQALDAAGIAQLVVLTLPDTNRNLQEFGTEIMKKWGIGHKGKDDGVLLLANAARIRQGRSGNRVFLGTGQGTEGIINDAMAGRILDQNALPAFARGDASAGLRDSALAVAKVLQGDRTLTKSGPLPADNNGGIGNLFVFLAILAFLALTFRSRSGGYWGGGFGGGFGGGGDDFGGGFGGGDSGGGGAER